MRLAGTVISLNFMYEINLTESMLKNKKLDMLLKKI